MDEENLFITLTNEHRELRKKQVKEVNVEKNVIENYLI